MKINNIPVQAKIGVMLILLFITIAMLVVTASGICMTSLVLLTFRVSCPLLSISELKYMQYITCIIQDVTSHWKYVSMALTFSGYVNFINLSDCTGHSST